MPALIDDAHENLPTAPEVLVSISFLSTVLGANIQHGNEHVDLIVKMRRQLQLLHRHMTAGDTRSKR